LQQLTTPEIKEFEVSNPGENWFYYWKTSPSLWEGKISEMHSSHKIFIPIYWAFHEENDGLFDFARVKPETDLKRLCEIIIGLGKEPIFFVPIGPQPYLPNGGLPSYLVRTMSLGDNSIGVVTLNPQNSLCKHYSFFDPRVFKSFRRFAVELGQYFSNYGISSPVYGLNSGYIYKGEFISYFNDTSAAFDEGFSRYLKQRMSGSDSSGIHLEDFLNIEAKTDYRQLIWNLYVEGLKEGLPGHFEGMFKTSFIGGAPTDIFLRTFNQLESQVFYFSDFFNSVSNDAYPSISLLPVDTKKGPLKKLTRDLMNHDYIDLQLNEALFTDDASMTFLPFRAFYIITGKYFARVQQEIKNTGLEKLLNQSFNWMYSYVTDLEYSEDEDFHGKVIVLNGDIPTTQFNNIIKFFMSGARVVWNTNGVTEERLQRIESFFYENKLEVESVNYLTTIQCGKLGEGRLITFDANEFKKIGVNKKLNFWKEIMKFLGFQHLSVDADAGIQYFWRHRQSSTYELNYAEIRRISVYNPTSYKKALKINTAKHFAFLKSMDDLNAEVKSTPVGIEVKLKPGGSISLDFGYYE
jgi:hypothetical protein